MTDHALTVPDDAHGIRLDKWLADNVPELSRARAQSLIDGGAVAIAGHVVDDSARKVKAGEKITIAVPAPIALDLPAQPMDLDVVFEDEDLIVVNKPAGLVVHPAVGNYDGTLVNALLAHCGDSLRGIGGVLRPGIVHRIDKDTSGLLVVAKTAAAHAGLAEQFAAHDIERRYDALVWGVPTPLRGVINAAIGRSPHDRQKMAVLKRGGKEAETGYAVVAAYGVLAAQVQCALKTGRTHQIRVHMSSRGHPLIGDQIYGRNRKLPKSTPPDVVDAVMGFERQALHAATLGFIHPTTGKSLRFARPAPDDFKKLENALAKLAV